ncbi:LuxR C-terminal-related transcriptional regulator [Variovorax sp. YR752]|uniref:LuxR C-terminal-related transcriptional regulator n=1 Tax=Variovorax sp. YR752 TaxID=1884383 RepID=UPI0031384A15
MATEIVRSRLSDVALGPAYVKLILVRAPAGFGKTTAMAQMRSCLEDSGTATAWLTLDRADNDVSRFLRSLRCCVDHLLDEGDVDDDDVHVLHRISAYEGPFVLFLDDFETIHAASVHEWVRELITHLPPNGRLIIGSRNVPDLRLGRLRALSQMVEIDTLQLRFSLNEASELFGGRHRTGLAPEELSQLHGKTEGWVTGLWLASMALDRHAGKAEFVRKFSGSNLSVADYLLGEVFEQQPEQVRQFLLRTSILKELTPGLCNALVPQGDSAAILQDLSAENVLLTLVEGEDQTYRYHSLFASFLQCELRRQSPSTVAALHQKAARWFAAQDRPVPAIDHHLESGELSEVLPLMSHHIYALLAQGRMRLLERWFSKLPPDALQPHPRLKMAQLWTLCFTRGPWAAMAQLNTCGLADSTDEDVWPHVSALRPMLFSMMDRQEDAFEAGQRSLARLPSSDPFADGALISTMAGVFSMRGQSFETLELMSASRRSQSGHSSQLHRMYAETMEGTLDLFAGRIHEAHARFRTAVTTIAEGRKSTGGNAWAGLLYALTTYERNQTSHATDLLRVYVPQARDVGLPDHMIQGYRMLSRIAFLAGDVDEAFRLLTELEALGHERQLPRVVTSARLERSRVQLLQGHAIAARQELARVSDDTTAIRMQSLRLAGNDVDYPLLANLRWEAVSGDAATAAMALTAEATVAFSAQRRRRGLALELVLAIALARAGREFAALSTLESTLRSCHRQGFVRMVLDEGPQLGVLVRQLHDRATSSSRVSTDVTFLGYLTDLREGYGSTLPVVEPSPSQQAVLLDPLTEKEVHVLHLLAEGYSNIAMAEKLGITDSTVRTHLRNINSKLAAGSRMQAVSAARRLGIVR